MTEPLESLEPYSYESLGTWSEDEPRIRLLELHPRTEDADTISLDLRAYELHKSPPYECLSYCWGAKGDDCIVVCNSAALTITSTLYTALRHLQNDINGQSRIIWIDQIAINQKDDTEKSQQVGMMRNIYENAERTVAWLGEGSDGSDEAIRFLHYQRNHLLEVFETADFPTSIGFQDIFTKNNQNFRSLATPSEEIALSIVRLLKRPWFRRSWIVQEVAVSKEVLMKCGDSEIDFEDLFNLFNITVLVSDDLVTGRLSCFEDLSGLATIRARSETAKRLKTVGQFDLLDLLYQTHRCGATDPRDKLFALYGITSTNLKDMGLEPDYTIPAFHVFIKSAFALMTQETTLRLLEYPYARSEALPSWVPNWSDTTSQEANLINRWGEDDSSEVILDLWLQKQIAGSLSSDADGHNDDEQIVGATDLDQTPLDPVDQSISATNPADRADATVSSEHQDLESTDFDATRNSIRTTLILSSLNRLCLSGHIIDRIIHASCTLYVAEFDYEDMSSCVDTFVEDFGPKKIIPFFKHIYDHGVRKLAGYIESLSTWESLALKGEPKVYPNGESRERAYWKTLCAGDIQGSEAHSEALYKAWRKMLYSAHIGKRVPLVGSLVTLLSPISNGLTNGGAPQRAFATMTECTLQRKLAKTANGYLGLVPKEAKEGDIISLLRGGRVPFVLRSEGGPWRFIGPCYLHGAMQGELWNEDECADVWLV